MYLTFSKLHKQKKNEFWTWFTLPLSHPISSYGYSKISKFTYPGYDIIINELVKYIFTLRHIDMNLNFGMLKFILQILL